MGLTWNHIAQFIILVLALRALHMVSASTRSCAEVRRHFTCNKIGPDSIVPRLPVIAENLRVCPNGVDSCCNSEMETHYGKSAKKVVELALETATSSLRFNFDSFAKHFQMDIVRTLELAGNSTRDSLRKFLRKRNIVSHRKEISLMETETLFYSLGLNATRKDVRKAFDRFADQLFLYIVDDKFNASQRDIPLEQCISNQRKEMDLFVATPAICAENVSNAIEYARALHEALPAGAIAVNVTDDAHLTRYCQNALVKMQYCSHCWGITLIKPCQGLCQNVMRGCLAGITELNQYWNYYVNTLVSVTGRMRSSQPQYNLEVALGNFEDDLKSSISTLLVNISAVRQEVARRCEKSRTLERSKRTTGNVAEPDKNTLEEENRLPFRATLKRSGRRKHKKRQQNDYDVTQNFDKAFLGLDSEPVGTGSVRPPHEVLRTFARIPSFRSEKKSRNQLQKRLIRFVSSLNVTMNFFRWLPDSMCTPDSGFGIQVSDDGSCWDGYDIAKPRYTKGVVAVGYEKQVENPEVSVLKVESDVIQAIEGLRRTTAKLTRLQDKGPIADILLRSPVYKERKDSGFAGREAFPCDDEDDCGELGSGGADDPVTDEPGNASDEKLNREIGKIEIILIEDMHKNRTSASPETDRPEREKCKGRRCHRKSRKRAREQKTEENERARPNASVNARVTTTTTPENASDILSPLSLLYIATLAASKLISSLTT